MAKDSWIRIHERNETAAALRSQQGFFARIVSGVGLAAADTFDFVTGLFTDSRQTFVTATLAGIVQGAVLGTLAAAAFMAFAPAAVTGGLTWGATALTLAGAGAALRGIYTGQKALEAQETSRSHGIADAIAEKTGAVDSKTQTVTKEKAHKLLDEVDAELAGTRADFAKRVDESRANLKREL